MTTCEEFIDIAAVAPLPRDTARARLGVPADAPVVGSVGLPDWRKDPEHLLRAVASLPVAPSAPWIVWIGGEPDSADGRHLADEARRLGLDDRFRHVAHVDRPADLLGGLDVFALPAREDAMPLAAIEAAAAGLPIACFRTGGIAGLCDRGAGTAVDYPDTAAFADAIAALLDDPTRAAAVGAAGTGPRADGERPAGRGGPDRGGDRAGAQPAGVRTLDHLAGPGLALADRAGPAAALVEPHGLLVRRVDRQVHLLVSRASGRWPRPPS